MNKQSFSQYTVVWENMIGSRKEQQDAIDIIPIGENCCVTVCDGMGGMQDGAVASQEAIVALHRYFECFVLFENPAHDIPAFLENALQRMDAHVAKLRLENGQHRQMGTTVVTAIIWENMLFWMSVGDSRLYIFRDGELIQATRDHNYLYTLNQLYNAGIISEADYYSEQEKGDALTSYIGINGIEFYDICKSPFRLRENDIVILMSDGIYKSIDDPHIRDILSKNRSVIDKAESIVSIIQEASQNRSQDNASFVLIKWGKTL